MLAAVLVALALVHGQSGGFVVQRLVSDRQDARLVNAWGLAASSTGPWWIASEARSSSTVYAGTGQRQHLVIHVPGGPTGVVFNAGRGFVVGHGDRSGPARFIYACEDGMIRGWSPAVPHGWSHQTEVAIDAGASGAVFRGLALAGGHLYATDFHNGRVLVFDAHWRAVSRRGAFLDGAIPSWYAPFGIQAIGRRLFVTYAWRAPVDGNDAPTGGYVDEFDVQGRLVARVGRPGQLDEPWGVALAPRGFGRFGGDLLVASFGSGRLTAYSRVSGVWRLHGRLLLRIPGVWGIAFGRGGMSGPRTTLFYAAGPHTWHGASELGVGGELGAITPR